MTKKAFVFRTFAEQRDEWMRRMLKVPVSELSPGAKTVAIRLALYMNEKKQRAFPGYEELGVQCGMSARMVQTHTKRLEGKGGEEGEILTQWLTIIRKRNTGNTYWLHYPWIE